MGYIDKSLTKDEELKYRFGLNKYTLITPYFLIGLSFLILLMGGMFPGEIPWQIYMGVSAITFITGIVMFFQIKSIEYGVTSHRVIKKTGIIARNTEEILNKAVETVEVKQPIIGRILDFGDVIVTGRGNSIVHYKSVDDPLKVKREIEESVFSDNN